MGLLDLAKAGVSTFASFGGRGLGREMIGRKHQVSRWNPVDRSQKLHGTIG